MEKILKFCHPLLHEEDSDLNWSHVSNYKLSGKGQDWTLERK